MTFEEATDRLLAFAQRGGGVVTASQVEGDPELAAEPLLVSAVARQLDGSTNVFGTPRRAAEGWFPFEELQFTELGPIPR
jgi:hypothetical protein